MGFLTKSLATLVAARAHQAATSPHNDRPLPTDAQKKAGNYKLGRITLHGLSISIENPAGSFRTGKSADGTVWRTELKDHYGYIRSSEGADGDAVDVFIGPHPESEIVFVVDQVNLDGKFDEHKCLLGCSSEAEAREVYLRNYSPGWKGLGAITALTIGEFKAWLEHHDTTKPIAPQRRPLRDLFKAVGALLSKARVREYTRRNPKSGTPVVVREHHDSRVHREQFSADTIAAWRKVQTSVPVRIDPGPLATIRDLPRLRAAALDVFQGFLQSPVVNSSDGQAIRFTNKGFREIQRHSADRLTMQIIPSLPEIVRAGRRLLSEADKLGRPNVAAVHQYGARAIFKGQPLFVRFVTKEEHGVEELKFYDAYFVSKKKLRQELRGGPNRISIAAESQKQPASGEMLVTLARQGKSRGSFAKALSSRRQWHVSLCSECGRYSADHGGPDTDTLIHCPGCYGPARHQSGPFGCEEDAEAWIHDRIDGKPLTKSMFAGLFGKAQPRTVKNPGSRGGHYYMSRTGRVVYGERTRQAQPTWRLLGPGEERPRGAVIARHKATGLVYVRVPPKSERRASAPERTASPSPAPSSRRASASRPGSSTRPSPSAVPDAKPVAVPAESHPKPAAVEAKAEPPPSAKQRPSAEQDPSKQKGYGKEESAFSAEAGTVINFRYRVASLADLKVNDPEVQPRARTRSASVEQVNRIARTFNPHRFMTGNTELDRGLPIVGSDLKVESGNGRMMAVREMARIAPEKMHALQALLREHADRFGLDPSDFEGIKDPIVVRERTTTPAELARIYGVPESEARKRFADDANARTTLATSPAEQAATDAQRISPAAIEALEVGESQTIDQALGSPRNAEVVRQFLSDLPANDRNALITGNGSKLTPAGVQRLKAAILAHVFPGPEGQTLVTAATESSDSNVKNLESGVFGSLGLLAKVKAAAEKGSLSAALDVSGDIPPVVHALSRIRQSGGTVDDFVRQESLINSGLSGTQKKLLVTFAGAKSAKTIREFLLNYCDLALAAPPPGQGGLFGSEAPTKDSLLQAAARRMERGESPMAKGITFLSRLPVLGRLLFFKAKNTHPGQLSLFGGGAKGQGAISNSPENYLGTDSRGHRHWLHRETTAPAQTEKPRQTLVSPLATFTNTEEGVHAHVWKHERGFSVSVQDADTGNTLETIKIHPTLDGAVGNARKIVGADRSLPADHKGLQEHVNATLAQMRELADRLGGVGEGKTAAALKEMADRVESADLTTVAARERLPKIAALLDNQLATARALERMSNSLPSRASLSAAPAPSSPQASEPEPPKPAVTRAAAESAPGFRSYDDGKGPVRDWEVSEQDFIARRWDNFMKEGDRSATSWQQAAEREKSPKKKQEAEYQAQMWRDIAKKRRADGPSPTQMQRWRDTYIETVKKAISKGEAVPQAVVNQRPEFQKAQDARARYDKGRHTSFANESAAVDRTMQAERGYKVKRQDGKKITAEQIEEIARGVGELESVFGSTVRDIMRRRDLTIAHTNGKHPFLSDAAGLYHPGDQTISIGVNDMLGRPLKALAHEWGHWLDFASGSELRVQARMHSTSSSKVVPSLAEENSYGDVLINEARRRMNDTVTVRRALKKKLKDQESPEAAAEVERIKFTLGAYWNSGCEIFARLVEQYVATVSGGGESCERSYTNQPAYWTASDFAVLMPKVRDEIARRITILGGNPEKLTGAPFDVEAKAKEIGFASAEQARQVLTDDIANDLDKKRERHSAIAHRIEAYERRIAAASDADVGLDRLKEALPVLRAEFRELETSLASRDPRVERIDRETKAAILNSRPMGKALTFAAAA